MSADASTPSPMRPIVQLAYAVHDAPAAAARWHERVGAGPFFVRTGFTMAHATHRGAPAVFDHSAAFGQWGPVMLELIEVHRVEPAPLAALLGGGGEGFHHMTWFADDLEAESARLERHGSPLIFDGTTGGGVRFLFHDARAELGHLIELYARTERVTAHYAMVAEAAIGWDGRDPVRAA